MKAVQGEFTVDLFCFRNDQGKANTMEGVRQVMIYQDDFAVFKNYAKHDKEKFRIRLRQAKVAAKQIKKIGDNYDLIVVQHMMFLLEMGKEAELLRSKVVLYPMFTGKPGNNLQFVSCDGVRTERRTQFGKNVY